MMGLGKLQRLTKFEIAGFIYYGNIKKLVFKMWDKPKWGTRYYLEQLTLPLVSSRPNFSYSKCNCCGATTTANGWFLRKTAFYNGQFYTLGACKVGVKNYYQTTKRHTLTPNLVEQIVWRMWQWRCFDTRERREKKYARIRHWKLDVVYNTTSLSRRRQTTYG